MTFGSLFTGIGGIDLGLERAGWECRWHVENEPFCNEVLAARWPQVRRYGDIRSIRAEELEPVDCIAGGYPCQPFSYAGKRAGEDDPRHLWPEFARILRVVRPRFAILENVPGHLSLGFGEVLGDLAGLGYDAEWRCVRASDFGASHLRKRVFVVAYDPKQLRRRQHFGLSGSTVQTGSSAAGAELANSTAGGWGISREPSREWRGLAYGAYPKLENARRARIGRPQEPAGISRPGPSVHDCRAGGEVDDSTGPRLTSRESRSSREIRYGAWRPEPRGRCNALPDPGDRCFQEPRRGPERGDGIRPAGEILSNSAEPGLEIGRSSQDGDERAAAQRNCRSVPEFAPGPSDARWPGILSYRPDLSPALSIAEADRIAIAQAEAQSKVCRVADGTPDRLDRSRLILGSPMQQRTKRLKALGNAVVPQCAEWIARRINEFLKTS